MRPFLYPVLLAGFVAGPALAQPLPACSTAGGTGAPVALYADDPRTMGAVLTARLVAREEAIPTQAQIRCSRGEFRVGADSLTLGGEDGATPRVAAGRSGRFAYLQLIDSGVLAQISPDLAKTPWRFYALVTGDAATMRVPLVYDAVPSDERLTADIVQAFRKDAKPLVVIDRKTGKSDVYIAMSPKGG